MLDESSILGGPFDEAVLFGADGTAEEPARARDERG